MPAPPATRPELRTAAVPNATLRDDGPKRYRSATFDRRWSVWERAFGGTQTTGTAHATTSFQQATSRIFGGAVGAGLSDTPNTLAGFALAGATNFSVANGLGSGHSDLFQARAYVRQTIGASYLMGALAYGWQTSPPIAR